MIKLIVLFSIIGSATVDARPRPAESGGDHKAFETHKTFGLGLELGEPTSLNGKYFYAADKAIDFGIGDTYDYNNYRGFTLYADHLWHPFVLTSADAFELPFYVGVGGQFWQFEDYRYRYDAHGDSLGLRVPIGLAFDFNNVPLDIFVQVVPTADLFFNTPAGYDRTFYLWFNASVGIRYWFK